MPATLKEKTIQRYIEAASLGHDALGPVDSISVQETEEGRVRLYDDHGASIMSFSLAIDVLKKVTERPDGVDAYNLFWELLNDVTVVISR